MFCDKSLSTKQKLKHHVELLHKDEDYCVSFNNDDDDEQIENINVENSELDELKYVYTDSDDNQSSPSSTSINYEITNVLIEKIDQDFQIVQTNQIDFPELSEQDLEFLSNIDDYEFI